MSETQASIAAWAEGAFGPAPSLFRILTRANEELAELLRAIAADRPAEEIIEECADVAIVLVRAAVLVDHDLQFSWALHPDGDLGPVLAIRAAEHMAMAMLRAWDAERGCYPANAIIRDGLTHIVAHLCGVCRYYSGYLDEAIERKMQVNRRRMWKRDGTGHGYHVRDGAAGAAP